MHYLQQLISQGEHQQLDFKFAISDAKKIARTLCSFSNTDGGKLLIGVKDNGTLYGIRSEEEYYVLEAASEMYCRPKVKLEFKKWTIQSKTILEVTVPRGNKRPYFAPAEDGSWHAYIRVNDHNLKANRIMTEVWRRTRRNSRFTVVFSEKERALMKIMEEKGKMSFTEILKYLCLTVKDAEEILIKLACINVVHIQITPEGIFYAREEQDGH